MSWTTRSAIIYGWDITKEFKNLSEEEQEYIIDNCEHICDNISSSYIILGTVIHEVEENDVAEPFNFNSINWYNTLDLAYLELHKTNLQLDEPPHIFHVIYYT